MLTVWETYLETLCRKNKTLAHLAKGKRSWIGYGTDEAAPEKGMLHNYYVKHTEFEADGALLTIWRYQSSLQVLMNVNISKGNTESAIRDARRLTLKLAEAIDARIIKDYEDGVSCNLFTNLDESRLRPIGPVDESAYGWQLDITFSNDRAEVDPDEWDEDA
jgi:hypothetical protein